jgi:hypothetical protein
MTTIHSYDFLINNSYDRIKKGKHFDEKLKPYTKEFTKDMIQYFELKEEFEKCQTLQKFNDRFDHEKNYKLNGYTH